jgi:hypothetical protein
VKCPDLKNHPATKLEELIDWNNCVYLQEYDSNYEGSE